MALNASVIVLGFTGSLGSGCTYIAKEISEKFGYKYCKLSDIIRRFLTPDDAKDVQNLQNKGNELRASEGESYLVQETIRDLQEEETSYEKIVIDGIKHEKEVEALKHISNFFLFSVHASEIIRQKRLLSNKIFNNPEQFKNADLRDRLEENPFGQQVKKCDYQSDIILLNDSNIPTRNSRRKDTFIGNIYWHYIKPIEDYAEHRETGLKKPSIDELCMVIAYSISKMSGCIKRKVGAVIIRESSAKYDGDHEESHTVMPHIVSSGYNEVPLGQKKCIYSEYQMCYRDYLQESHAKGFNNCPRCGTPISITFECPDCHKILDKFCNKCPHCSKFIKIDYKCGGCKEKIFDEFIPGAKNAPGKLLDMCRALHAEEVAILNLIKNGIAANDLILYTTTQPCNLCANKITNAGIKKVVFSEPYTMEEAEKVLKDAEIETIRFQGIKSNAFFKLYQN